MSYEIPAALRYEEKIIFNLSMRQSLWLGLFTLLAVAMYSRLRLAVESKAMLAILTIMLGFGFAFLDFRARLSALIGFFGRPRQGSYFDLRMLEFTGIGKIRNDTIFMKNGQAKAVIQVQPINFHLLSENHRKSIVLAYRDFLNSLDFPIQIAVRTVDLSMNRYFETLESRARLSMDRKVAEHLRGFREFTESYIRLKGAKNRLFYIVIPSERAEEARLKIQGLCHATQEKHEAEKTDSLELLDGRVKACMEKLQNCGLISWRLRDEELAALLGGYFDCFMEAKGGYMSTVTSLEAPARSSFGSRAGAALSGMRRHTGFFRKQTPLSRKGGRPRKLSGNSGRKNFAPKFVASAN